MKVAWPRDELRTLLRGPTWVDEPLARHTTYRLGGPVDLLVEPEDLADLRSCLEFCRTWRVPCQVLGEGSNVLVADRGLAGVVIRLSRPAFTGLEQEPVAGVPTRVRLRVGAGLTVGRLVALARTAGLNSLVFLAGIPGTVGGGVRMNAGTSAGEFGRLVEAVEIMDREGCSRTLAQADCGFGYRRSGLPPGALIASVRLLCERGEPAEVAAAIDRYLRRRRITQPSGPSAGCVFKNPPGQHAGQLIDEAGLKGLTMGGAQVSPVHANFIVAGEGATAAGVASLIQCIRRTVQERTGIWLEPENLLLGFPAAEPLAGEELGAARADEEHELGTS